MWIKEFVTFCENFGKKTAAEEVSMSTEVKKQTPNLTNWQSEVHIQRNIKRKRKEHEKKLKIKRWGFCLCPGGMTVLGQMRNRSKRVNDYVVSQKTLAEGKYTLGLQPPLWKDLLGEYKMNLEFDVSCADFWLFPISVSETSGDSKGLGAKRNECER